MWEIIAIVVLFPALLVIGAAVAVFVFLLLLAFLGAIGK